MEGYGVRLIGIALWALVPGFIAKGKGRSFWGYFFLSFLISPLITMIITICLSNLNKSEYYERYRPISDPTSTPPKPPVTVNTATPPVTATVTVPAKVTEAPPAERGQLPRYVALDASAPFSSDQTEYRFLFAAYDEDFVRKCAQAVISNAKVVISVLVTDFAGSETNILRPLQSCGMKIAEHPELAAGFSSLSVDALVKTERIKAEFRPGTNIITVLSSRKMSEADATVLMDQMIHQAIT